VGFKEGVLVRLLDIFKKPETKPLPSYRQISLGEIPPASAILFYGGNKLTEMAGNRLYKHPYAPPAFHAAFYIGDSLFLNVGKFRTIEDIGAELRSTRRVDIIIYKMITPDVRRALCHAATMDCSKPKIGLELPDYAIMDYLRFGLRFLKPSKKDFCSENCVELFATGGISISDLKACDTAPWDIQEFAEAHPDLCEIRTLWVGPDFSGEVVGKAA
jgi:hypothetical protein